MADESRSAASEQAQANSATLGDSRPVYEIGFHLVPTIPEGEVAAEADKVRALLGDAEIINAEVPSKFKLTYVIERAAGGRREKYADSYFGFIKFAIDKEAIPAIEQGLRSNRNVLRSLLIETVREDLTPKRAVFSSDRLEGETIHKPDAAPEEKGEVSEEELNKSLDALVS